MKRLFFFFAALTITIGSSNAQTITNKTTCDIVVDVACELPQPGCWYNIIATIYIASGATMPFPMCSSGVASELLLHFYYDNGCSADDPYVGLPGNCFGFPQDEVMHSSCDVCTSPAKITYLGGFDWEVY